ncbi:hypothetical protein B7P43_G08782 [Cryptotermes secundus]|uniref:Reverse transcriptase domain-containing protein n=1 Tax=Cryptotermes secundus TaxID=105785 RepID=A0A2J7RQD0_9NEOP|nr:hypothetical protein B7P43_G08782 [Cryptotermes secundus]
MCLDHNLFPDSYTVLRSDRMSANKTRGGGVLTALSSKIRSFKRRCDLESYNECVWVEIPTLDNQNLIIGNHYFSPDTKLEVIANYFRSLEDRLDTKNFRVVIVGDFNAPGFDWNHGLAVPDCHYYSKLRGDAIYTSTCLLNLQQCIDSVGSSNLLDLVFTNFNDYNITFPDSGIIKPDTYHPPMVIGISLPLVNPTQNCEYSYRKYIAGDYTLLYNILSNYDWSCVYDTSSVDAGAARLSAAVQDAMEQAIPRGFITKSKFPHWFSSSLRYYIRKKNYFYRRFKKHKSASLYDTFSFYRKLVKATIKIDRLRWLESINANLKTHPKQFWQFVASFRKKSSTSIQLIVDGTHLVDHYEVANAFAEHFQSVYNSSSPGVFPSLSSSSLGSLTLSPITDSDIFKAIARLKPFKSVGLDNIPAFVIKGCSDILAPVLKHIFSLTLSQQCFPALWKQAAVVPIFKKGHSASVNNYRPVSILNNFSKLFEYVIHHHVSHDLKLKLNPCQHGFTKCKSTTTNLVTYLDFITPLVGSQRQVDAIYFDLTSAFGLVPHSLLLHKLSAFGFSGGYVNWIRGYLTNRQSRVRIGETISSPFEVLSGVPQGSVLGPLLLNVYINGLCDSIKHSRYLLSADDIRIYRAISCPEDCNLLQSDVDCIRSWCAANCMKLNADKTKVITFSRKINYLIYEYKLLHFTITRTYSVKDLGVYLDSKLHFHDHVNFIFSECIKMLGIIRSITFNYSTLGCMLTLYFTLVRFKVI